MLAIPYGGPHVHKVGRRERCRGWRRRRRAHYHYQCQHNVILYSKTFYNRSRPNTRRRRRPTMHHSNPTNYRMQPHNQQPSQLRQPRPRQPILKQRPLIRLNRHLHLYKHYNKPILRRTRPTKEQIRRRTNNFLYTNRCHNPSTNLSPNNPHIKCYRLHQTHRRNIYAKYVYHDIRRCRHYNNKQPTNTNLRRGRYRRKLSKSKIVPT